MRKVLFNIFAIFILYGLLSVAVITLAQPPKPSFHILPLITTFPSSPSPNGGNGEGGGEGTPTALPFAPISAPPSSSLPSSPSPSSSSPNGGNGEGEGEGAPGSQANSTPKENSKPGVITGAILGSIFGLLIFVTSCVIWYRYKSKNTSADTTQLSESRDNDSHEPQLSESKDVDAHEPRSTIANFFLCKWYKNKNEHSTSKDEISNSPQGILQVPRERSMHNQRQAVIQVHNHGQEAIPTSENTGISAQQNIDLQNFKNEIIQAVREEVVMQLNKTRSDTSRGNE